MSRREDEYAVKSVMLDRDRTCAHCGAALKQGEYADMVQGEYFCKANSCADVDAAIEDARGLFEEQAGEEM